VPAINFAVRPCPGPDDINWSALWASHGSRLLRALAVLPFLIFMMVRGQAWQAASLGGGGCMPLLAACACRMHARVLGLCDSPPGHCQFCVAHTEC
jgi:hypothetical protein